MLLRPSTPPLLPALERCRHRLAWVFGIACLAWQAAAQAPLIITDVRLDVSGRTVVRLPAAEGTYSILYRGDRLDAVHLPAALESATVPGTATLIELTDPEVDPGASARFYRVEQVPVGTPLDLDGDGIDDAYELERRPTLNPLHPGDAQVDHDGDQWPTLAEYLAGRNPLLHDAVTTDFPMPTVNTPYDPNPTDPQQSLVQKLLVYAVDTDGVTIPTKTFSIVNNSPFTVFPVMRDANDATLSSTNLTGLYDPYDPTDLEYRGYIGYRTNGQFNFGLPPGTAVTFRVPLVFWNGARMGLVTDGRYLTPGPNEPNPLRYDPNALRVIASAEPPDPEVPAAAPLGTNAVVMWYRAGLIAPALDSPDQLVEWTIRDQEYLSNPKITARTQGRIPDSEKVTLINYDVSYVDNMFLPVAMEALSVPVPAPPTPFTQNPYPFGWIGSTNAGSDLQVKIRKFTASNNALLGTYFGTNGWPMYNIPPDPAGQVKIPAGQNIFAQSPLAGAKSSYDLLNNRFMLSSGGTGPITVNIGGEGTASSGTVLTLSRNEDVNKVRQLQPGYTVVGYAPAGKPSPIQPGTRITQILHVSTGPNDPSTVELDKPLVASQEGCNFDFSRPVTDYASAAMIKLWFSWADYYLAHTQTVPSRTAVGAVTTNSARLSFAAPVTGLIEGMLVTGPGLDAPNPAQEKGGVVILAIAADQRSVTLSQLARENHSLSENQIYTVTKPQPLPVTPADRFVLDFSKDPVEAARDPLAFSRKVYLIMASMAQIPKNPDPNVVTPHVLELMNNVVGGNMGFIFDTNERRFSSDGLAISAMIRDMIKSVLRGVTDFTQFAEYNSSNQRIWYPDPKVPRGGLTFNAFNLDPFVWFVHVTLGFSGYGFSLDDDTADVGAGEARRLMMTVGGPAGLANTNEWTIQAVYGPVIGSGDWDPTKTVSFYDGITDASNASPIVITSALHGLSNGERVTIDEVVGNTAANGTWTVANVTQNTFELANSTGNGVYTSGGRWTRGPLPYIAGVDSLNVYWRLKGDDRQAGFTGALLTGPGVPQKGMIRIAQLGDNQLAILALNTNLVNADGSVLAAGRYTWTFSGK